MKKTIPTFIFLILFAYHGFSQNVSKVLSIALHDYSEKKPDLLLSFDPENIVCNNEIVVMLLYYDYDLGNIKQGSNVIIKLSNNEYVYWKYIEDVKLSIAQSHGAATFRINETDLVKLKNNQIIEFKIETEKLSKNIKIIKQSPFSGLEECKTKYSFKMESGVYTFLNDSPKLLFSIKYESNFKLSNGNPDLTQPYYEIFYEGKPFYFIEVSKNDYSINVSIKELNEKKSFFMSYPLSDFKDTEGRYKNYSRLNNNNMTNILLDKYQNGIIIIDLPIIIGNDEKMHTLHLKPIIQ